MLNLKNRTVSMSLTKKEIRYYKPLILSKLNEMGVKNEIGYTKTGSNRQVMQYVQTDSGYKMQNETVPNYRAANLYKSLTKKLLKMTPEAVERFLDTIIPKETEEKA